MMMSRHSTLATLYTYIYSSYNVRLYQMRCTLCTLYSLQRQNCSTVRPACDTYFTRSRAVSQASKKDRSGAILLSFCFPRAKKHTGGR